MQTRSTPKLANLRSIMTGAIWKLIESYGVQNLKLQSQSQHSNIDKVRKASMNK